MNRGGRKWVFGIILLLILSNIIIWKSFFHLKGEGILEVTFFDVGQGDSIFIEDPCSHQILIDGGPDNTVLEKLSENMPFWDNSLDLVILTHPEHDHIFGLIEVLKRYKVDNVLWTGVLRDNAEYKEWDNLLREEGANISIAREGLKIFSKDCSSGNIEIEVLYPFESLEGEEVKNMNDSSVVLKLSFKESSFLFTGDISGSVEKRLGDEIDSDVLKVGHHGSKTSTSEGFLEKVSPMIAVISAGRNNSYGHPHPEVLERLKSIEILRTDTYGDIKILNDGKRFSFPQFADKK